MLARYLPRTWLHSQNLSVAIATALQTWPRHLRSHLLRRQKDCENGTLLSLGGEEHGISCGKGRVKRLVSTQGIFLA